MVGKQNETERAKRDQCADVMAPSSAQKSELHHCSAARRLPDAKAKTGFDSMAVDGENLVTDFVFAGCKYR